MTSLRKLKNAAGLALLASPAWSASLDHPATPKRPVQDTYHGVTVSEDYRGLEDLAAPEVTDWVAAQNRLTRQVQRLERNVGISTETLALFVRFWLTITPPLPSDAQAAAQAKGRERYEGFIEALGRRLQKGQSLMHEIPDDVGAAWPPEQDDDSPKER